MPRERHGPESDPVSASLLQLEQSIAAIQDSDTFRAYLTAQAKFHTYSFGNVLLILSQKPDAARVAGYRTWQSLDRQVKKGEKAIRIIAPASYKKKDQDAQTGEELERQVAFFRSASVFDYSQTEGEPLPEVPVPVLDSEAGGELYARLAAVTRTEGLHVVKGHERFHASEHLMGFYERENRLIAVRDDVPQLQATKTLAHEAAHHFANHQVPGAASETEAEGVAFIVLAHHGLDAGQRSFPYIATWAKDKAVLKAALATIQKVSTTIIDKLNPDPAASQQGKAGHR